MTRGQVYRVDGGAAAFQSSPSPEMKRAVTRMLAVVAKRGNDAVGTAKTQPKVAAVSPASLAFNKAVTGKDPEKLIYMDLGKGRVVIELRPDLAPKSVDRIKRLARDGFYDGLGFHFVRRGYLAETGDPTGTGGGGSGEPLAAEFSTQPFERGVVGMSRKANDPNSADSQFFVALGRAAGLDGKYTAVGNVIHGIELLDALPTGRPPKTPEKIVKFRVGADVKN